MKKSFVALAFISSTCAFAGNYVGAEAGYGFVDIKAEQTAQTIANLSGQTVRVVYDKAGFTGRGYFGIGIDQNIAVEIGYFATANLTATYTLSGASAKENYSASGLDASLVFKPAEEGVFFKVGMHNSKVTGDASITVGGTTYNVNGTTKSGTGLLGGIGYEAKLANSPDVSWRAGWTYYNKIGGLSDANVNLFYAGIQKKF